MPSSPDTQTRRTVAHLLLGAPRPRWVRAALGDAGIVVLLALYSVAVTPYLLAAVGIEDLYPAGVLTTHIVAIPLALLLLARRRCPLAVYVALLAGGTIADYYGVFVWVLIGLAVVVACYSVGRYQPLARASAGLGLALVLSLLSDMVSRGDFIFMWQAVDLGWLVAGWVIGRLVRTRAFHLDELRDRAAKLERANDAHARAVVAEERSRIARELHDIIAHHVSVMTVQAAAGRRVIGADPDAARGTLAEIEGTGRQAMAEMRRLVGVLRASAPEEPGRGPQPGLGGLADLARQVRETGLDVTVRTEGEPTALPPGLDLTLYRVAQESLTNVLKHAGPRARAEVLLRFAPGEVLLRVADNGTGAVGDASGDAPGHGLVGMRERVGLFGGELRAGPRAVDGFRVEARVPLPGA